MQNNLNDHLLDINTCQKFTQADHHVWEILFNRQIKFLENKATIEFINNIDKLGFSNKEIPSFFHINKMLKEATGWQIVPVKGFLPEDLFFELLAERKFPSTSFIRKIEELDYLEEPDIFHDVFGHLPLLIDPVFANFMELFGKKAVEAIKFGKLKEISRLYWFTVEFGLINSDFGPRIYGSGIVSSSGEVEFSLSKKPHMLKFDAKRIMRTDYRIDNFQKIYFVIKDFNELFETVDQDLTILFSEIENLDVIGDGVITEEDEKLLIQLGENNV